MRTIDFYTLHIAIPAQAENFCDPFQDPRLRGDDKTSCFFFEYYKTNEVFLPVIPV
jgi:hypothetical protein